MFIFYWHQLFTCIRSFKVPFLDKVASFSICIIHPVHKKNSSILRRKKLAFCVFSRKLSFFLELNAFMHGKLSPMRTLMLKWLPFVVPGVFHD